ncbi:uncharacterized protein LOC136038228 [Artemia franciscana]|uniref:Uncharacterized protein n=1 Tax=Artemia franciscana TaxID=6661 RepID=A0AA88LEP5_ARTSF|nr:hypothetical protein QYM36_005966 [Artemia franciscana]
MLQLAVLLREFIIVTFFCGLCHAFVLPTISIQGSAGVQKPPVTLVSTVILATTTTTFPYCFLPASNPLPQCRTERQLSWADLDITQSNGHMKLGLSESDRPEERGLEPPEVSFELVRSLFEGDDQIQPSMSEKIERAGFLSFNTGDILGMNTATVNLKTITVASVVTITANTQTLLVTCTSPGLALAPVCMA